MTPSRGLKNLVYVLAGAVLLFLASQWVGSYFQSPPTAVHLESVEQVNKDEKASAESEGSLDWLPEAAARAGIRLVASPDPHAVMFVHPESPCWVDVPRASTSEIQVKPRLESGFLGAEVCAECHQEVFDEYKQTGHYLSSAVANAESIEGSFERGQNKLTTNHPDLSFEMQRDGDKFFEMVQFRELTKQAPIDLVTGSGHIGQTFLYWVGNSLYQLPVSYFRAIEGWSNSPGYHDGTAWFSRPVISKCLECHATYVEGDGLSDHSYIRSTLITGISCERCHGPGREHVDYHRQHSDAPQAKFITNPGSLSSEENNDLCAQCHFGSGQRRLNTAPFSFRPGDTVEEHFEIETDPEKLRGGVHSSNQLARLQMSKCFQQSEALTCVDCHNPHANQRGNKQSFSRSCLDCHQIEHCGKSEELGPSISENCIDCHMPLGQDTNLVFNRSDDVLFPLLRDHFIQVVDDAKEQGD